MTIKVNGQKLFKKISILLHVLGTCLYWFALHKSSQIDFLPEEYKFGGKFKFLTHLNLIFQCAHFTISLVNDILGQAVIKKFKDFFFASIVFPFATSAGLTFWLIWAVDRELVFPTVLDKLFSKWLNHVFHTSPMILSTLDLIVTFHQYPSRRSAITGIIAFLIFYLSWIQFIKLYAGFWTYPVLEYLNFGQRIMFFAATIPLPILTYFVGEISNNYLRGKELGRTASISSKFK